mgnify:CR=1 FL=1
MLGRCISTLLESGNHYSKMYAASLLFQHSSYV